MSRGHRALTFDSTGKTGPKTEILLSHEEKAMPLGRRWSAAGWVPRPNIYGFGFQESDTHPPRWQRGPHVLPSCFANVHGKRKPNERNPDQKTDGARKRVEGRPAQEEDAGTRVRPRHGGAGRIRSFCALGFRVPDPVECYSRAPRRGHALRGRDRTVGMR
ncbi:hypothetical protein GW17_00005340 [Ensete ventricosum]|nr:hypothetical protein GW17_00005340 [Ensete ventricosum]